MQIRMEIIKDGKIGWETCSAMCSEIWSNGYCPDFCERSFWGDIQELLCTGLDWTGNKESLGNGQMPPHSVLGDFQI